MEISAQVKTVPCNWDQFGASVRLQDGAPIDRLFRGQADASWALVSPIARGRFDQFRRSPKFHSSVRTDGKSLGSGQIEHFKILATGLNGVDLRPASQLGWEALARHNGLTSNLLDWSDSPYIAAFFAFSAALDSANDGRLMSGRLEQEDVCSPSEDVCVWRLGISQDLWIKDEFEFLSSHEAVNRRQKAQLGAFTRLSHDEHLDLESYLKSRSQLDRLTRFVIPGSETWKALHDLNLMNINFATVYPDLYGAAMQANAASMLMLLV